MIKTLSKISLYALFAVLALLLVAVIALYAILGTEGGRLWLADKGLQSARQSGLNITLENLQTTRLGSWQFDYLEIKTSKPEQPEELHTLLKIENMTFEWAPARLLKYTLQVSKLNADSVQYFQTTTKKAIEETAKPKSGGALALSALPRVLLDDLRIKRLQLHNTLPENPIPALTLAGRAEAFGPSSPLSLSLDINSLNDKATILKIDSQAIDKNTARFAGHLVEPDGGWLGAMLKLPVNQDLKAEFDLELEVQKEFLNLSIENFALPLFKHQVGLKGTAALQLKTQTLDLKEFALLTDGRSQKIRGSFSSKDLWFEASFNELPLTLARPWVKELSAGQLSGTINGDWIINETHPLPDLVFDTQTQLVYKKQNLSATLAGQLEKNILHLEPSQLSAGPSVLKTHGTFDFKGNTNNLYLALNSFSTKQLKPWGITLPVDIQAEVSTSKVLLQNSLKDPEVNIQTQLSGVYLEQTFSGELEGSGNLRQAEVKHFEFFSGESILKAHGNLDWTGDGNQFEVSLNNINQSLLKFLPPKQREQYPSDLSFNANGDLSLSGSLKKAAVDSKITVEGDYTALNEVLPYQLIADAQLRIGNLEAFELSVRDVELRVFDNPVFNVSGQYRAEDFDVSLSMNRLPTRTLALLGVENVTGEAKAQLNLKGSLDAPILNGDIEYTNQIYNKYQGDVPFTIATRIETKDDVLSLNSLFKQEDKIVGDWLITSPVSPFLAYANGKSQDLPTLAIEMKGKSNLNVANLFVDPNLHVLEGKLASDLSINGKISEPAIQGFITLENGRYHNIIHGTELNAINLKMNAKQQRIEITQGEAQTPDNGSLNFTGKLNWHKEARNQPDAIALNLKTKNARLVQRRDIQGAISGELTASGSFKRITTHGKFNLSPLNINLNSQIKTSIAEIKVNRVHDENEALGENGPEVDLDIRIDVDHQAYLRGRGLETEIKGFVAVKGTAKNPQITGEFNTHRGKLDALGKHFVLQNGSVRISNEVIGLRIPGVHKAKDYEYTVEVYGTSEAPKLRLSSIPPLPEDEILSRLIFGKSVQEITPFQAIRLASAVKTLSSGSSFDPLESTRKTLGVDTLNIESQKTEEKTGVSVGVGKYISEKVYLEVERTPDPVQPWQGSVEIELTPKVSLEAGTGETGSGDAEILWKKDY